MLEIAPRAVGLLARSQAADDVVIGEGWYWSFFFERAP